MNYVDGVEDGQFVIYHYDDETGKLRIKETGEYLNDQLNNTRKVILIEEDENERILMFENYTRGVKNGLFQKLIGDSLIIGNYQNDKLHGKYKIYLDFLKQVFEGVLNTDTANLFLMVDGNYYEGKKSGYWKNYIFPYHELSSEGNFLNGQKTGEWKYYHLAFDTTQCYKKPYLIQNYLNGKLHGKSVQYSYIELEMGNYSIDVATNTIVGTPTYEKINLELEEDTYSQTDYDSSFSLGYVKMLCTCTKIFQTTFYKNGKLNGPFEFRDSTNKIIEEGFYKEDLKDGKWISYFYEQNVKIESTFVDNEKIDKKYFTLKGKPFSGKFVYYDDKNEVKEIRKIKKGLETLRK